MSKGAKQTAQVETLPARVQISGYTTEFFVELQRLVKLGYQVSLEGADFPHCLADQWHMAVMVLPEA